MTTLRIAFAGLAHSHPFTDAGNLRALQDQGEKIAFVAAYDSDAAVLSEFSHRFAITSVSSLDELAMAAPDLVIATPRPHEIVHTAELLLRDTDAQLFFNKVVAASDEQLSRWNEAIKTASHRVGTSSVLRFAPALEEIAERVEVQAVQAVRVLAQHDISMFLAPDRRWQDDPSAGGGTLVTVGTHAWEMIGRVFPGAVADNDVSGWIHRSPNSRSSSEDGAAMTGTFTLPDGTRIPYNIVIGGSPGPEIFSIDVFTSTELLRVNLEHPSPDHSLGYTELARTLISRTSQGIATAPWSSAHIVVGNTIRTAQALRGESHKGKSPRHV